MRPGSLNAGVERRCSQAQPSTAVAASSSWRWKWGWEEGWEEKENEDGLKGIQIARKEQKAGKEEPPHHRKVRDPRSVERRKGKKVVLWAELHLDLSLVSLSTLRWTKSFVLFPLKCSLIHFATSSPRMLANFFSVWELLLISQGPEDLINDSPHTSLHLSGPLTNSALNYNKECH